MSPNRILFVISLLLIFTGALFGQDKLKITGRVLDSNGAAIAGASISVNRSEVRFERQTVTDSGGSFEFNNLPRGTYQISATAKTFASAVKRDLQISDAGGSSTVDFVLQPAQVAAEVSVTSSYLAGTPESLNEIPGSIERIDARSLENARVFNFSEALRKFSGVNVRDEEGFGLRPNIGIRGTNPTRSTKVLLLEDGLPLSYAPYGDNASYYHPPVERYESIEVLKGSGQIAYGPQTIAGVINYLTPNPPDKPSFNFKLEGGNRSFFNGGAGFGGTFGRFGGITNFTHKQGDGSRENTNFKLYDFSSKATYALNSRNALTAKFTSFREDSNLTYTGATEAEFAANPRGNRFKNDFFYGRRYGFSLQHAAVLTSNVNLTTNFYSNYFSRDWWRQSSNSAQRPNRLNVDADCRSLADLNTTCGNEGRLRDYSTTGIEPRLNANFNTGAVRNELNIGFRIHREDQNRIQKNGDLPFSRDGVIAEDNKRQSLAYSGFIQHRFIWRDFAFTPGVRVERIEYERTNHLANNGAGATGNTIVTEIIPGFGVAYSGLRNTTIFAGVHRGFAPPRVEDVVTNAGGVVDLDSELSWNYEIGVRARPVRGVEISSAFFRNDYENQIVAASIASGTAFTNGGKTLQQGFEFTGQVDSGTIFRSTHNFYFRTAYTFLPTAEFRGERFSSITTASILQQLCPANRLIQITPTSRQCSITGNRLPYAPKTQLTSSIGYSHPIGVDAFVENVFIGRQFGDDLNAASPSANAQLGAIPAQTYWNATANYKVEKWRTTFFATAKNIFDRTFIVDRSRGILPSQSRLIQVGIKLNF
ncbi:MAG: carboxypeptidase regulatory-like domain-containing protein [Acidobacteriota bacterium]|nr:carboxypeptidase regulatory-like domain-containing protein [Acidobacteriota bacterium]